MCLIWSSVSAKKVYFNPHYLDSMNRTKADITVLDSIKNIINPFQAIHKIKKFNLQPTRNVSSYSINDIVFLIFLLLGGLLVLVRSFYPEFFLSTREALSNPNLFNQRIRDKSLVQWPVLGSILIFRTVIFSLGITILFVLLNDKLSNQIIPIFGIVLFALFMYSFPKSILEFIVSKITKMDNLFVFHFIQTQMIMGIVSLLLLPIFMYFFFSANENVSVFSSLFFGLYIMGQLFNIIRLLLTDIIKGLNFKLYFFIYLCAFKILPIMILGKYLQDYFLSL